MNNSSSKRGVELTMNTMIIAALVLLILIILAFILINSTKKVSDGSGCVKQGGECASVCQPGYASINLGCTTNTEKCCMKIIPQR